AAPRTRERGTAVVAADKGNYAAGSRPADAPRDRVGAFHVPALAVRRGARAEGAGAPASERSERPGHIANTSSPAGQGPDWNAMERRARRWELRSKIRPIPRL